MSPLNWHQIMNCSEDDLNDDQVDEFYNDLLKVDVNDETDVTRLQRLFVVTRSVMQVKGMQAEVAIEELEQMAKNQGKMSARREKELTDEIHELQQQLKTVSRHGRGGETQTFKNRVRTEELEHQLEQFKRELNVKDEELARTKSEFDKLLQLSERNDKERLTLKEELRHVSSELDHCRRELENQDSMVEQAKGKKEQELLTKIKNKNKQIHQLLDDIKQVEHENENLSSQVSEMKSKIEDAVQQIESATSDYIALGEAYQQSEVSRAQLAKEKDILQTEVHELQNQLQQKLDTENEIMMTVSERVEQWKAILSSKEEELSARQQLIHQLEKQIETSKLDSDRAALIALTKAVEERDEQISELRNQVEQATLDLEENTAFLEGLHPGSSSRIHTPSASHSSSRRVSLALELQASLRERTQELDSVRGAFSHLQEDAERKDKELNQVLVRMRQYEMGEYGLADAVAEIKDCKSQLRLRDSQIEELTQQLNYAEVRLDEYSEENEELRKKLNMEPSLKESNKSEEAKPKKRLKLRSDVLKEKVEQLEEDNLELQHQVHKLSTKLRRRNTEDDLLTSVRDKKLTDGSQVDGPQSLDVSTKQGEMLQWLQTENEELHHNYALIKEENAQLHQGMKEILQELRDKDGKIDMVLKCPTLEKLVQAIEVYEFTGSYDPLWVLKSRVDQLQGENDALRSELKGAKNELALTVSKLRRTESKVELLEKEEKLPSGSPSLSHGNQTFTLDHHTASSTTSLDGCQELNPEDPPVVESNPRVQEELPSVPVDGSDRPRLELLYRDYLSDREALAEEKHKWIADKEEVLQEAEKERIRAEQFEALLKNMEIGENDMKKQLMELNHQVTAFLLNESTLAHHYSILQDSESDLRKENILLKKELLFAETQAMDQIGQLRRSKELAFSQLKAVQRSLEESVPLADLELADHRFTELSIKYRDLLDKHHSLASLHRQDSALQAQIIKLQNENQMLLNDIAIEKEKFSALDTARLSLDDDNGGGTPVGSSGHQAVLKLKEASERQRADHAVFQYEQLKASFTHLEGRNKELERTLSEITAQNLQLQADLVKLSDKIEGSVPKDVHDLDKGQLRDLEASVELLKQEASEAKCLADVARHQSLFLETANKVLQKELEITKEQLEKLQETSQENMNIGKLYRQILTLQLNEATLQQKVDQAKSQMVALEAHCIRQEIKCDQQAQESVQVRNQCQNKMSFLRRVLQELRRQYCGAVPLARQEKVYRELQQLKEEKAAINKERMEFLDRALAAESHKEELEFKCQTLEETIRTLKSDGETTSRILEWHQRMETLQLQAIRSKKAYEQSSNQVQYLESEVQKLERRVGELEEENTSLEKSLWEKSLWVEEASTQDQTLKAQVPLAETALSSFPQDKVQVSIPEPEKSKHFHSSEAIKEKYGEPEDDELKKELAVVREKLKLSEENLFNREQALNELRLQFPSSNQVIAFTQQQQGEIPLVQHYETKQSLKVAQATISCLQARLSQKSESLSHHQELLSRLRQENASLQAQHEEELKGLHDRLQQAERQVLVSNTRAARAQSGLDEAEDSPRENSIGKLVAKCGQLEETVSLQERSMASLSKQLLAARQETANAREEAQAMARTVKAEHDREVEEIRSELVEHQSALESRMHELAQLKSELESERQHLVEEAPLKELVEELKSQLTLKEEQMQMLKEAMAELRSELDDVVKQNQDKPFASVQKPTAPATNKILDNKVKDLQGKLAQLEMQKNRLSREVEQKNEIVEGLEVNVEALKIQMEQKDSILSRAIIERDDLKRKFDRLKESTTGSRAEVSELNKQIRYLEEQLQRNLPAEKPFVEDEKAEKSREEIARWEEGKRWQGTVERLRSKLKTKEDEVEHLEKTNKTIREQLVRLGREKILLENRVKALSQKNSPIESPTIAELKRKNMVLEEQLQNLKHQQENLTEPKELEDLRSQNKMLFEKLIDLEKQLARCNLQRETSKANRTFEESHSDLKMKNNMLQKQIIKLNEEKFELKVAFEKLRVDVPRLKQEKETLEAYVSVLKADLAMRDIPVSQPPPPPPVQPITVTTVQENPKSTVIKKTEASGNYGSRKPIYSNSMQSLLDEKTTKIVNENRKQQQELKKLQNEVDKLQHRNRIIEQERRELQASVEKKSQELVSMRALVPSPHLMNPKQYKTYVVTRMYEGKLKATEDQLKGKMEELEDTQRLFQRTSLEAESLRTERDHYKEKADAYEQATLIVGADVEEQLRHSQSKVVKLEAENNELQSRLLGLESPTNQVQRGIPSYSERLLRENAQLRVQVRVTQMEFQKMLSEVKQLREEVERAQLSLKSSENQNVKLLEQNKSYQDQLHQMSKQFGFSSV